MSIASVAIIQLRANGFKLQKPLYPYDCFRE